MDCQFDSLPLKAKFSCIKEGNGRSKLEVEYFCLRTFNSDAIENLVGNVSTY